MFGPRSLGNVNYRVSEFMSVKFTSPRVLAGALLWACAAFWPARGAQGDKVPILDLSSANFGWLGASEDFLPPLSGPHPITFDKDHPYFPNTNSSGQPPTFRVADLTNPILKPWAIQQMRKVNEQVLGGKTMFTREVRCWPLGVPGFLLYRFQPVYFIQTPKQVWMVLQYDHEVRRVYLNRQHSAHVTPSWYGESVGHYEGDDTLVVDTIGLNTKAFIDNYRTPHTEELHVVERFKLTNAGKALEVNLTVEDPGAFTMPWSAIQRYRRADQAMLESNCAENDTNYFNLDLEPMPQAEKPDF